MQTFYFSTQPHINASLSGSEIFFLVMSVIAVLMGLFFYILLSRPMEKRIKEGVELSQYQFCGWVLISFLIIGLLAFVYIVRLDFKDFLSGFLMYFSVIVGLFFAFSVKSGSRKRAVIVALFVSLSFLFYIYMETWGRFYQLTIKDQKMHLLYFYPKRMVELDQRNLKSLKQSLIEKGQGFLVIEMADGKKYKSSKVYSIQLNKKYKDVQEAIISQLKTHQ